MLGLFRYYNDSLALARRRTQLYYGPSSTTTILECFVKLPPKLERDETLCMLNRPARAHTAAPHCDFHCHHLHVYLTPHFLWRQATTARSSQRRP